MKNLFVLFASIVLSPAAALAHPGHGKPGFLHSHSAAELADWAAMGALILLAVVVLGVACWAVAQAWHHLRK